MTTAYYHGTCRGCGRRQYVRRRDGMIGRHSPTTYPRGVCTGADQPPVQHHPTTEDTTNMTDPAPPPVATYRPPPTAEQALQLLTSALAPHDADTLIPPLQSLIDGAPEIHCPRCGAAIRARMADHPDR